MTHSSAASLCGAATVFVVQDVLRSVEHYRDALGFHTEFTYGQPTFYAGVERDGVVIHLQAASQTKRQPGQGAVNVFVTDVDALYQELKSRGARVLHAPQTTRTACVTSTSTTSTATSCASGWSRSRSRRQRRELVTGMVKAVSFFKRRAGMGVDTPGWDRANADDASFIAPGPVPFIVTTEHAIID